MPGSIQSIERAAAILRQLSGREHRVGVADLSRQLGLSKGTVHGLLRTLVRVGYVEQDPDSGKYQLGPALLHMGSTYLDGNELRGRARHWADALASHAEEAVYIGRLHYANVLIVHHVFRPDDTFQRLEVGSLLPAHATALGKVLLASQPQIVEEVMAAPLAACTDVTVTDIADLRRQLAMIREQGFALEVGELAVGRASIASPIFDRHGAPVGAIGVTGPVGRLLVRQQPRAALVARVRDAGRAVSRELGALPW